MFHHSVHILHIHLKHLEMFPEGWTFSSASWMRFEMFSDETDPPQVPLYVVEFNHLRIPYLYKTNATFITLGFKAYLYSHSMISDVSYFLPQIGFNYCRSPSSFSSLECTCIFLISLEKLFSLFLYIWDIFSLHFWTWLTPLFKENIWTIGQYEARNDFNNVFQ